MAFQERGGEKQKTCARHLGLVFSFSSPCRLLFFFLFFFFSLEDKWWREKSFFTRQLPPTLYALCLFYSLFSFFFSLPLSFFSCEKGQVEGKERRERKSQRIFVSLGESALCCRPIGVGLAFLVTQLSI